MKDILRLLVYFAATVLLGALLAPPLYWIAQQLISNNRFLWLARFDFETFFHRALLIGAVLFLAPLLRSLEVRRRSELGLLPNPDWKRDAVAGFAISAAPLLLTALVILVLRIYTIRASVSPGGMIAVVLSTITVPLIEETFFRGLILGVLLRAGGATVATLVSAAFFSVVHFLKAPEGTNATVTMASGFISLAHAFDQFRDPILVAAGFSTLFLIGCILAHARLATHSLWMPIGMHAGWIFISGEFNKVARREFIALPWLGKTLLVGFVPLLVALATWAILFVWLKNARRYS